jgi:hypothetical protein
MINDEALLKLLTSIITDARTVQASAKMLEERADKLKKQLRGGSPSGSKNLSEKQAGRLLAKKRNYLNKAV